MPLSSALRFLSVLSGPMALAESRPVDVCQLTIYGLNSGVFLSTPLHLPYPDRGVVWHSVQSVFTRLFTPLVLLFCSPGYVHLYVKCHQPIAEGWTVFHHESGYRGALSRRVRVHTAWSSLDRYLITDSTV